jgi:N-acetyldiaminopimelate deacetylase
MTGEILADDKEIPGFCFAWGGIRIWSSHAKLTPNEQAIETAIKIITEYVEYKGINKNNVEK